MVILTTKQNLNIAIGLRLRNEGLVFVNAKLKNLTYYKFIDIVGRYANLKHQWLNVRNNGKYELRKERKLEAAFMNEFDAICEFASKVDYDAFNRVLSGTK